mgnify:FL=1
MRQTINGADFRRMLLSAAAAIEINKQKLNELNVFPVPDGDTGTNMSMTINAAASDLRKLEDPTLEKAASAAASAMLRGARGNSGVILSLLLVDRNSDAPLLRYAAALAMICVSIAVVNRGQRQEEAKIKGSAH